MKDGQNTLIKNRMLEFVEEGDGSFSATRLAFLLWVVGVLLVWIIDSIIQKSLQTLPPEVATVIGILMTGKVVQKFGESKPDVGNPSFDQVTGKPDH